ncbi:hypothetical protein [Dyadobacter crusticola]|uniref:hypothetical protein n=1 Tax=Dyadobacter crusticola TaxID=292407 RepID=UPI0004E23D3A|nr:hypothetical protein [Dyadobacter crusticola]
MEAVLRIQSSEFTDDLIEKIKLLLRGKDNAEITISISESPNHGILRNESREAYFSRLERALVNLEEENVVTFSGDTFEQFSKHVAHEE